MPMWQLVSALFRSILKTVFLNFDIGSVQDADEAVVYPAKVDQSWVDADNA